MRIVLLLFFILLVTLGSSQIRSEHLHTIEGDYLVHASCISYQEDFPIANFLVSQPLSGSFFLLRYNEVTHKSSFQYLSGLDVSPEQSYSIAIVSDRLLIASWGTLEPENSFALKRYDLDNDHALSDSKILQRQFTHIQIVTGTASEILLLGQSSSDSTGHHLWGYDVAHDTWDSRSTLPQVFTYRPYRAELHLIHSQWLIAGGIDAESRHSNTRILHSATDSLTEWKTINLPAIDSDEPSTYLNYKDQHCLLTPIADSAQLIYLSESNEDTKTIPWPQGYSARMVRINDSTYMAAYPEENGLHIYRHHWTSQGQNTSPTLLQSRSFYIYPNPVEENFRIQAVRPNHRVTLVEIFSMSGKKMLSHHYDSSNPKIHFLDHHERSYIIRIWDNYGDSYIDKLLTD